MLTFYDEKGNGYGAQVEFTTKNAVNGERSVSGTILSNDKVLSKIDRGWSFDWDGETYKIIFAKPKDEGRSLSVSFDAVHQFFYDFDHSNCYQVFNGSNRFEVYIEAIFKNSGYRYVIEAQANAIRKENFGNAKRLSMFKDVIKAAGLEFSVTGKVVRIVKKVGTDLSTVVRKNFNMNELTLEKNIGNFITYKKGFGAWKDENNHDAGRYETEYESPLARIYGRIEGEPVTDERYKEAGKLLERLKHDVDSSYSISVQLEMEDLTRAGYKYTQPRAGDYIMAINETIGFREKIRIVSYESSYDVTGRLIKHKVTCNDIGTVQKAITSEGSIARSVGQSKEYAESALAIATKALVSADGKNTIYYGAEKPRDQPRGTLHRGDLLYLTVGEETEMYFWNGAEWELKILKFDSSKLEKMFTDSKASTDKAIAEANKRAEEALKKAGTLPDTAKLSDQIKQQILTSQDLTQKVSETLNQTDSNVIYNKIYQNISRQFATRGEFDNLDREQNNQGLKLIGLSKKVETQTVEFQKLTESNKLYERIIGTSETDAPDKLSRLVMSSEIFQTEVGKYSTQGGPNMLRNSRADDGLKYWVGAPDKFKFTNHVYYLNGQKQMFLLENGAVVNSPRFLFKRNTDYVLNLLAFDANTARVRITLRKRKKDSTNPDYDEVQTIYDKTGSPAFSSHEAVKRTFKFNTGDFDNGYLLFQYFGNPSGWSGMFMTELDFYEGTNDRKWQPAPEDSEEPIEAVRTQVTQLDRSWSVRNLNSAGDVLGAINLNPDGSVRINEGLLSVGEKTIIKDGVIKKSMIGKAQIGTAHIDEIDASTARLINVSAKNITADGLTANVIKGGKLSSLNGVTDFDLQTGWLEMNNDAVGIRNQFRNKPIQYLVFGEGAIGNKPGTYTALMSNSNKRVAMDDGSAGIQIWNTNDNTTAVNIYGDLVEFMYNATDPKSISIDTITNKIWNLEDVIVKNKSIVTWFNNIDYNFQQIINHFKQNDLGWPSSYRVNM